MQEAKTQKNRKSLLNQNTSPKPAMKDKMTPNKTPNQQVKGAKSPFKKTCVSPKTPRDNGVEGNKTPNMSNKKRKSVQPNLPENDNLSPKKSKLDIFAAASKLISSVSADASPAAKTKVEGNNPQFDSLTRSQRKRLKAKLKRKSYKSKQQEMIEKLKENDPSAQVMIKEIAEKIAAIKQRPSLTSTSRRKLRDLNKLLRTAEGKDAVVNTGAGKTPKKDFNKGKPQNQVQGTNKMNKNLNDVQKSKVVKNKVEKNQQIKKKQTVSRPPIAPKDDDEESDAESDYVVEGSIKIPAKEAVNMLEDDDDEDGDDVAEEEDDATSDAGDDSDDEQSDEENNIGESSEEESDEVLEDENGDDAPPGKPVIKKEVQNSSKRTRTGNTDNKSPVANSKKGKAQSIEGAGIVQKGQSRYVLYVNNLPYDAEKQEIIDHFAKIGAVKDVRIPTDMKTKKPRGFAYVEVNDQETYEKALSLHHTILKGRRINVLYTLGGKKKGEDKKKEIKVKNFKLNAMRQQGMLAGSVKDTQKRSARRAKKNNVEKSSE